MTDSDPNQPPDHTRGPELPTSADGPATGGRATGGSPTREAPGARIGPYRLLQLIGEGGFGTVFMAEQERPVQRKVALKIIKLGMDTRQVIARFEQERQALAMMDHPHIARVLDAGATEAGRPYFVMELVKGEPITEYCDKNNLSIPDRLELFSQVCRAVQHAHTKGIIHRDLKPSNILVSVQDGRAAGKVIDFGIAKATASKLTEKTVFTEHRQLIGTPEYMSPEQAEGSMDIDTRTDVYSLGVLLYELLTGSTPFDSGSLRSAAYAEVQRIIRQVEPPRPSTRLNQSAAALAGVAARRHTEPRRLGTAVRGELDWIVMKALEKDRQRRYETASGLEMDVRRYLGGEAVLAAPPSRVYRARKFVRRHRAGVTAAGLVGLALVLGLAGTAYGLRQEAAARRVAQREAERASKAEGEASARAEELNTVADFQANMLKQIDPTRAGRELTADVAARFAAALASAAPPVPESERPGMLGAFKDQWDRVNATDAARGLIDRTILRPAIRAIDEKFRDQPVVDARLRQAIAARYIDLALYDSAMPLLTSAVATRRRVLGEDHLDTLNSLEHMGLLLQSLGRPADAEPIYRGVYEARLRVQGIDDPLTLSSRNNLGNLYRVLRRYADAEPLLRSALDEQRRVLGNEDPHTMASMNTLGQVYMKQGKKAEAEVLWREAYDTAWRVLGEDSRDVLVFTHNLSMVNMELGRLSEAAALRRELLAKARRVWGEEHPDTLTVLEGMGLLLREQGKPAEAEACLREALEKRRRIFPAGHGDIEESIAQLADLLDAGGGHDQAERLWRELLDLKTADAAAAAGDKAPAAGDAGCRAASVRSCLGGSLCAQSRFAEAEPLLVESYGVLAAAKPAPGAADEVLRAACGRMVKLYRSWDRSEPGTGRDAKLALWTEKLAALTPPPKPAAAP